MFKFESFSSIQFLNPCTAAHRNGDRDRDGLKEVQSQNLALFFCDTLAQFGVGLVRRQGTFPGRGTRSAHRKTPRLNLWFNFFFGLVLVQNQTVIEFKSG